MVSMDISWDSWLELKLKPTNILLYNATNTKVSMSDDIYLFHSMCRYVQSFLKCIFTL